jgi:TonB-dependent starch-binding outer membrane protein SusC
MKHRLVLLTAVLALWSTSQALAQTRIITGKVTDSLTSEVVTSGQVAVQGSMLGATVKDDGTFTLAVPLRDATLTIRSIGFKRRTVTVTASQTSVDVALERDYFQLEAIVVTGQATGIERKNLANAVATVSQEQLTKTPAASIEQSMQGKLAGAMITQNSGAPGGGMVVRLRGVTSIIGAYTPLYVVDGVIVSDVRVSPGTNFISQASAGSTISTAQENPINRIGDLNPNDIANIEVLKGASAAAIYGSKASNGVIVITTKRGRVGTPQFTLSQRFGVSRIAKKLGMRVYNDSAEAASVFGPGPFSTQVFDFEEQVFGNRPLSHETAISMSGGTETSRYFASGLVKHDGGIMTGTFYDKQSLRLNLGQDLGSKLTFDLNSDVTRTYGDRGLVNNENNGSSPYSAFSVTPTFFDFRAVCPDGSRRVRCAGGVYPVNPYGNANPLHTVTIFENRETVWRFIGAGKVTYQPLNTTHHTLRFIVNGGADFFDQKNAVFSPPDLQFEAVDALLGTSVFSATDNLNLNVNANVVHTLKTSGGTSATTQFGVQYETRKLGTNRQLGANLVGGLNLPSVGTFAVIDGRREFVKDFGMFAQEEFLTFGDRLLLTLGLRADQSSNNGDPAKVFLFPKAATSYRLPFHLGVIDEFKVRAAMGASGNQPTYGQKFTELPGSNYTGAPATRLATTTGATDLEPERQLEIEGGFDATLLGSRVNIEVTGYQKKVTNLLLSRSLEPSAGFSSQIFNGGALRTRGLEISVSAIPIHTRSFEWNSRVNFWLSRCKLLSLPPEVPPFPATGVRKEPGKSCTQFWGSDSLGRLPGDAQLGASLTPVQAIGSRIVRRIGDLNPNYNMGISNDLTFKGLKLYALLDYQDGGYRSYSTLSSQFDGHKTSVDFVVPSKPGALTGAQRVLVANKCQLCTTFQRSNFLKLREVSLSFDVPPSLVHRVWGGSRYVRLSVSGRNLVTITPYPGTDPETVQTPNSLANSSPGEFLAHPQYRSFWLTIDLGF